MRQYLGPPRELLVRRLETDHHRAMRHLASAIAIVSGCSMVAIALFTPHARVGWRLLGLIGGTAAVLTAAWSFTRPTRRNMLGMLVLTWTIVVAVFLMW